MKVRLLLPWLLFLCSLAGLAGLYSANQKKEADLVSLRADSEQLQQLRAEAEEAKKAPQESDELIRLRKDHEELLRLRNEVRQLRGERQQLSGQVQAAQSEAEKAQALAQAQAQAIKLAQAPPTNTPEYQAAVQAFNARYGLQRAANPEQAQANACINNLRLIDAAKEQWATAKQKPRGAILIPADLLPYLPGNVMPACPAGGIYTLNPVGQPALCNIPGHTAQK
jgi:TolA-binding protein